MKNLYITDAMVREIARQLEIWNVSKKHDWLIVELYVSLLGLLISVQKM